MFEVEALFIGLSVNEKTDFFCMCRTLPNAEWAQYLNCHEICNQHQQCENANNHLFIVSPKKYERLA